MSNIPHASSSLPLASVKDAVTTETSHQRPLLNPALREEPPRSVPQPPGSPAAGVRRGDGSSARPSDASPQSASPASRFPCRKIPVPPALPALSPLAPSPSQPSPKQQQQQPHLQPAPFPQVEQSPSSRGTAAASGGGGGDASGLAPDLPRPPRQQTRYVHGEAVAVPSSAAARRKPAGSGSVHGERFRPLLLPHTTTIPCGSSAAGATATAAIDPAERPLYTGGLSPRVAEPDDSVGDDGGGFQSVLVGLSLESVHSSRGRGTMNTSTLTITEAPNIFLLSPSSDDSGLI